MTREKVAWIARTVNEAGSPKGFSEIKDLERPSGKTDAELQLLINAARPPESSFMFVRPHQLPFLRANLGGGFVE